MPTFGERVRQLRTAAGMQQKALAAAMGVVPSVAAALEKRRTPPQNATILKAAKALGVSPTLLLEGVSTRYDDLLDSETSPVTPSDDPSRGEGEAKPGEEADPVVRRWGFLEEMLRALPESDREAAYNEAAEAAMAAVGKVVRTFKAGVEPARKRHAR